MALGLRIIINKTVILRYIYILLHLPSKYIQYTYRKLSYKLNTYYIFTIYLLTDWVEVSVPVAVAATAERQR